MGSPLPGRVAMQESQEPKGIAVETARATARQLLEIIKTTPDPGAKRQLARRAFELAQFAAMPRHWTDHPEGGSDHRHRRKAVDDTSFRGGRL
jgi:hypothetical protein